MRPLAAFLAELTQRDIKLQVQGEQLACSAPEGALTADLVEQLRTRKAEIIHFLNGAQAALTHQSILPMVRTTSERRNGHANGRQAHSEPVRRELAEPADSMPGYPLSFAQQRLWVLDQLGSGNAYNVVGALRFTGPLAVAVLARSLDEIVQRHEVLRTTYAVVNNEVRQFITASATVALPVVELQTLPPSSQNAEIERLGRAEALQPFDLTHDLMVRVKLLRLTAESHLLLLTIHHIAVDGWSLDLFVHELVALYTAFDQGQPSPLPALPIQYVDYAHWQRTWLQGPVLEKQLGYWQTKVNGAPPLLALPTDRPRPAAQRYQGKSVPFVIEADLAQQLRAVAHQSGATLFMTLLTAFKVLLYRYTNQTDLVVGAPIANRNRREIEPLIGFFVNTVALRSDLSAEPTFVDLLGQVRQTVQEAFEHQDLPFEKLVEHLHLEREMSYPPLVQVVFTLQPTLPPPHTLPNQLHVQPQELGDLLVRFDLELYTREEQATIVGNFVYNSDLFDEATIVRMMRHFQTLLAGIVANPQARIAELPLLTPAESRQLLVEWNATAMAYPADQCIHHWFEEQVARTPDAVAVAMPEKQKTEDRGQKTEDRGQKTEDRRQKTEDRGQKAEDGGQRLADGQSTVSGLQSPVSGLWSLTYAELNTRANQLAHYLYSLGVGADTRVALCVERSLEMVVGLLAILKAGAAYVPIDPIYPPERIAFMVQDAQVSVLLTQAQLVEQLSSVNARIICLDTEWATVQALPTTPLAVPMSAEQLAYVIYTSGSTGQPKGVMINHRNVSNLIHWHQQVYGLTPQDRTTQVAGPAFDAVVWELWPTLTAGAALYIMDDGTRTVPEHILQWWSEHGITVSFLPTPLAESVLGLPLPENLALRLLLTGGDVFHSMPDPPLPFTVVNNYGPTENTVVTTWTPLPTPQPFAGLPPIGKPIFNSQVYLLDAHQQLVPVGVAGELCIGGASLAQGYFNRPDLTAEKFIANPFGAGQLYKTGDRARWRPDGNIEYLGRIDQQVKIRGFRIELGEIEAVLNQHPAVQEAVVLAREEREPSGRGNKQLVAYVVAAAADETTQSEHVTTWQSLYEESYGQPMDAATLHLNLTGWNSSYTGQPIPAAEMVEWVENTVAEIRSLQPQRVLEIGCGTGLLLARLAPACEVYWGIDYSHQAVAHVARLRAADARLAHVQLDQRMADEFHGLSEASFDCIILNSVVQYFPSVDYLLRVLTGAMRLIKPGGTIYIGDVRNLQLLAAYHASVQRYQASDELTLGELQQRIQQRIQDEEELLIDPAFFAALPQAFPAIDQVEVRLKRGRSDNELTRFRYQALLHIGAGATAPASASPPAVQQEEWRELGSLTQLQSRLQSNAPTALLVRNIPNARIQADLATLDAVVHSPALTVKELRTRLAQQPDAIDPADLVALAAALSYQVQITWASDRGQLHACFMPQSAQDTARLMGQVMTQKAQPRQGWQSYTNNPLLGKLNRTLAPQVRTYLQSKLPEYMVPSAFVLLDSIPLTPNGKVDRKALPAPNRLRQSDQARHLAPHTPTERAVATIWSEILGMERIGIDDNFFELGGHSLLATQVISRINTTWAMRLPLKNLFERPTVKGLAERVDALQALGQQPVSPSTPVPMEEGEL